MQDIRVLEENLLAAQADDERRVLEEEITGKVSAISSERPSIDQIKRAYVVDFAGVLARNPFGNRASPGKGKFTCPFLEVQTHADQVIRRVVNDKRLTPEGKAERGKVSDPVSQPKDVVDHVHQYLQQGGSILDRSTVEAPDDGQGHLQRWVPHFQKC